MARLYEMKTHTTGEGMQQVTERNFGYLIAYILPGFVTLMGVSPLSPTIQTWLNMASVDQAPSIGGFLYITLASVGLGMAVSAIRWYVIDSINENTGLSRPNWDDAKLQVNFHAFNLVVEHHYRYYQFYANTLVSLVITYGVHRWIHGIDETFGIVEIALILIGIVFWSMARDTLSKYYKRASEVLTLEE